MLGQLFVITITIIIFIPVSVIYFYLNTCCKAPRTASVRPSSYVVLLPCRTLSIGFDRSTAQARLHVVPESNLIQCSHSS